MPNQYASYDAMGNMTCRNTDITSGHTCDPSNATGAHMSYDNDGRLASWTAPSGTTATDGFLYDNAGNRVLQGVNTGNVTTPSPSMATARRCSVGAPSPRPSTTTSTASACPCAPTVRCPTCSPTSWAAAPLP